jgi:hypothetical protein
LCFGHDGGGFLLHALFLSRRKLDFRLARLSITQYITDLFTALLHQKSAFGLFTKPLSLEEISPSATRSPLGLCSIAKRAEVAIMCRLQQIFPEAIGGIAVVKAT